MAGFRDRRRTRYAGIWRGAGERTLDDIPAVEHSQPRRVPVNWRLFSGAIVLCLAIVLGLFFAADAFYIRSIAVGGLKYLTKEEVFAYADIANYHIFWVSPEMVRQNLMRSPSIANAEVTLSWPPNMVHIVIEEREPAMIWEQNGTSRWVDVTGRVMDLRIDRLDLIRISTSVTDENSPLQDGHISEEIVFGALELQEVMPDLLVLRYDSIKGLGMRSPDGADVWFGVGTGMAEKYAIYQAIQVDLASQGFQAWEINITDPDHPLYNLNFTNATTNTP
jgi:hypothetical protein